MPIICRGAIGMLALEHPATDEVAALVERDGPAERGFVRRHGFVHVPAVEVHARLQAQGVARAEPGRLHARGEQRVPERLGVGLGTTTSNPSSPV